ncbi:MAG: SPFH domain-containing protein [Cellulosilyticaceae bacterium]
MGFFKKQLLDIIQWIDNTQNTLVYMYPMEDQEIQYGAQLIVRPGQVAVFVEKGEIADVFLPGTHKLETDNLPVLGDLKGWAFGFKSPFKSDVFFVNTKEMLNNKWGTQTPIWIEDRQFGQVQIRAYGTYTFNIKDPAKFIGQISSTNTTYTKETISEQLKAFIITNFSDAVGSLNLTVAQLASQYKELSEQMIEDAKKSFEYLGVQLNQFTIGNISLPEEIEKALKELTSMTMKGSIDDEKLRRIHTLRQLDIMEKSAENDGLNAMIQGGMGLGMGVHMGGAFANGIKEQTQTQSQMQTQAQAQAEAEAEAVKPNIVQPTVENTNKMTTNEMLNCQKCGVSVPETAKFCNECGTKVEVIIPKSKFCMECGTKLENNAKFCNECGTKV